MKVSRKGPNWKRLLLFCITLVFIAGLALIILEKTHSTDLVKMPDDKPTSANEPTETENKEQTKTTTQEKESLLDRTGDNKQQTQAVNQPQPNASITLSASQDGQSVTILTKMNEVAGGTCKLTVTNGAKTTSQNAQVIYQPEFSSCAGFSVPLNAVGSGAWNIELTVTPSAGSVLTKTTTLEVQ